MISKTFWRGKSVIVSGASSGIGREISLAAAAARARVGLLARREPLLTGIAGMIEAAGGMAVTAPCDVTDAGAVAGAVARIDGAMGPADVVIACAGIHRTSWPLDAARARAVFDTNLIGTTNLLAAVLPGMLLRGRGHVCGVASIAAAVPLPANAAYCASKAAVVALLRSLRVDCAPRGVAVTTACPGFVDTPMVTDDDRARGGLMRADDAARHILRAIERGRAEAWFPRSTALGAGLLHLLPPAIREAIVRRLPPMEEADATP